MTPSPHDYFYQFLNHDGLYRLPSLRLHRMNRQEPINFRSGECNPNSDAFRLALNIIDRFYRNVLDRGALPIVLLTPNRQDYDLSWRSEQRKCTKLKNYLE